MIYSSHIVNAAQAQQIDARSPTGGTNGAQTKRCGIHPGTQGADKQRSWLSQVEMRTYSGPARRLWLGPQFAFKAYNSETQRLVAVADNLTDGGGGKKNGKKGKRYDICAQNIYDCSVAKLLSLNKTHQT